MHADHIGFAKGAGVPLAAAIRSFVAGYHLNPDTLTPNLLHSPFMEHLQRLARGKVAA